MVEKHALDAQEQVFRNLSENADFIATGKREHDLFDYQLVDGNGNSVPTPKPTIASCNARGMIVRGDPVIDLPPEPPYKNPAADDELEMSIS